MNPPAMTGDAARRSHAAYRSTPRTLVAWALLLALMLLSTTSTSSAQELFPVTPLDPLQATEQQHARQQTLEELRTELERQRQQVTEAKDELPSKIQTLQVGQVTESLREQAQADDQTLRLREEDILAGIADSQRQIRNLEQNIRRLEAQEQLLRNPIGLDLDSDERNERLELTQLALSQKRANLALDQQQLKLRQEWLEVTRQARDLAEQWRNRVEEVFFLQQEQSRREAREDLDAQLAQARQAQLERAAELRRRLQRDGERLSETGRLLLNTRAQSAEAQARLIALDKQLAQGDSALAHWWDVTEQRDVSSRTLQNEILSLRELRSELEDSLTLLEQRSELFAQQRERLEQRQDLHDSDRRRHQEVLDELKTLLTAYDERRERSVQQIQHFDDQLQQLESARQERIIAELLTRQPWPVTPSEWQVLITGLSRIPEIMLHQIRLSIESTLNRLVDAPTSRWLLLAGVEFVLLIFLLAGQRLLRRMEHRSTVHAESGMVATTWQTSLQLLRRNARSITVATMLAVIPWLALTPSPGLEIIVTLVLVGPVMKALVDLSWLLLVAPERPVEQRHPALYHQARLLILSTGILATIILLAHLSALPQPVLAVLDWLFMGYWLLMFWPLLRARRALLDLLMKHFQGRLWLANARVLSLLVPLILPITALIGLAGYLNLAWTIFWYWLILASVLIGWLVLLGLLGDLILFLKNYAIARASYGLLWTQEIIEPLHWTLRVLLFFGTVLLLYLWQSLFITFEWPILLLTVGLILLAYEALFVLACLLVERTQSAFGVALIRHARQPIGLILPATALQILLPRLQPDVAWLPFAQHALLIVQIAGVAWLLARSMSVFEEVVEQRYRVDAKDSLSARRVKTQVQMLRRIVTVGVYILATATILMTFPDVRQLGAGLLASAGVAGLVAGVAARPLLENLIAGIQIGMTQPIRLEDVVIVEGEWGRIEAISATYVVVRIWDKRRLVLPIHYFITKPFQNWTRTGADLLGTAFFYVDYTFPVAEGRRELQRILADCELWDRDVWGLQVTNTTDRVLELRALMSAPDASVAWDLRCHVREKFIEFLQEQYPHCLPKIRFLEQGGPRPSLTLAKEATDAPALGLNPAT
jgi:potassium-dependent mechanosensitive channel